MPTALELDGLAAHFGLREAGMHLIGFGPVAAAARCGELLQRHSPSRALLIGVAGTFDEGRWPVGASACFEEVELDGIGVGEGSEQRSAGEVGFAQWPGAGSPPSPALGDRLRLATPAGLPPELALLPRLLTACSASADPAQARRRRARYPGALAEDMEGFAVALACALAGVALCIVRGASNPVGERSRASWALAPALRAAGRAARAVLDSPWSAGPAAKVGSG